MSTRRGLRARRGALVMIVSTLFLSLVAVSGLTADLSRLGVIRAELQVSADAGVHAGMVQYLITPLDTVAIRISTEDYAKNNLVMQTQIPDANIQVEMGVWNGTMFNPGAPNPDAVRIQLSFQPTGLIMGVLGIPAPLIRATAVGAIATFLSPPLQRPAIVK